MRELSVGDTALMQINVHNVLKILIAKKRAEPSRCGGPCLGLIGWRLDPRDGFAQFEVEVDLSTHFTNCNNRALLRAVRLRRYSHKENSRTNETGR